MRGAQFIAHHEGVAMLFIYDDPVENEMSDEFLDTCFYLGGILAFGY